MGAEKRIARVEVYHEPETVMTDQELVVEITSVCKELGIVL